MKHAKKTFRFWKVPVAILLAGCILTMIAIPAIWIFLDRYDASTPLHGIREFFSRLEDGDPSLADDAGFVADKFTSREDFVAYLQGIYGQRHDDLKFAHIEVTTGTETAEQRYDVYRGSNRLGTLMLAKDENKGSWHARSLYETLSPYTVTAPGFITVYVNGTALDAAEETERITADAAKSVADFFDAAPQTVTYTVAGLLKPPSVTAETDCGTCKITTLGNAVTVGVVCEEQAFVDFAREVSHVYAHYVSQDAEFAELTPYLIPNTPFYKSAKAYSNYWYNKHSSVDFEEEKNSAVRVLDRDTYQIDLSFNYIVRRTHDSHAYPTGYKMLFIRKDGTWKLLDLTMA